MSPGSPARPPRGGASRAARPPAAGPAPGREEGGGAGLPLQDGAAVAEVPAAGVVTLALATRPWLAGPPDAAGAPAAPAMPEPAQPVYTRYWLHGKGPAPAGNLPVAVHLSAAPRAAGAGPADGAAGRGG